MRSGWCPESTKPASRSQAAIPNSLESSRHQKPGVVGNRRGPNYGSTAKNTRGRTELEAPSNHLISEYQRMLALCDSIHRNARRLERALFVDPSPGFHASPFRFERPSKPGESSLEDILGVSPSTWRFYGYHAEGSPRGKALCHFIAQIGHTCLDADYNSVTALAMTSQLNVLPGLFDRGTDNYFVCQPVLEEYLQHLERWHDTLPPRVRSLAKKTLFFDRDDRLQELRDFITNGRDRFFEITEDLLAIQSLDIDTWVTSGSSGTVPSG